VSYEVVPKARCVRAVAVFILLGALVAPLAAAADPPTPLNVLFVANGWCSQEDDIENHFLDLGYNVTRIKDYKVRGTTSFAAYDLIVLTESAPLVSATGLSAIKASGKPVLVVESWTFLYAYRLGLTTSPIARLSDGDTVTSLVDGYTAFTSRVGAEALVHQKPALIFGVNPAHLKSNAVSLYQSTGCMSGVAVFADYEKKIAVTGISDTASYTVDAWKMFDILVQQIVPAPPDYVTLQAVAQAYAASGLVSLLDQIESDLKQQPGSWTIEQAEEEAWLLVTEWRLDELWGYVEHQIYVLFALPNSPGLFFIPYTPPTRPNGSSPGYLPSGSPEVEHWFLGEHWAYDPFSSSYNISTPFYWSDYHGGTDLGFGISVGLNGRQYYYMGDTRSPSTGRRWSEKECDVSAGAVCNDMIVVSGDDDPSDGIVVSPVLGLEPNPQTHLAEWRWTPIVIPGVHKDFSPRLHDPVNGTVYWDPSLPTPRYTVPTGVVATRIPYAVDLPVPATYLLLPTVILWYGTAIHPSGADDNVAFDSSDPRLRPTSWVGCSFNGIKFRACYSDADGDAVPFSVDVSPPPPDVVGPPAGEESSSPGEPARFVQVAAIELTASDFESMCDGTATDTEICQLDGSQGGLLLYGSGRPYRKSGLFLAFIERNEFGQVDSFTGKPIVHYWDGATWSGEEQLAVSLTGDPPCDNWTQPDWDREVEDEAARSGGCWPALQYWDPIPVFGELSARVIRLDGLSIKGPQIFLLNNNPWSEMVQYWKVLRNAPWAGDLGDVSPTPTATKGYGPYIIDAFSDATAPGSGPNQGIVLWHTISVWDGTSATPYGVYSGSEVIPW
jgi:hypothetical protein